MLTERITEEIIKAFFTADNLASRNSKDDFLREYMEPVNVVDEDDNIIGLEYKGLCHALGLRHEAVFVLIVSPDGKILLEKKRDSAQDILDLPVESHIGANEDAGACAIRKVKEKFDFNPEIGRLKLIASYNRNCPLSSSHPREINNERRFLFKYFVSGAEMAKLSGSPVKDKKDDTSILEWYGKGDILEAINMGRTTDELLTCFIHYLAYKLPDSEIRVG
jgi:hypothetical protein